MIHALKKTVAGFVRTAGQMLPDTYPDGTVFLEDPAKQIFFGYYDVTPFQEDGQMLLATRAAIGNESPHENDIALELGYYNLQDNASFFQPIATSISWNWQQGCRLQWLPGSRAHILYNTCENEQLVSKVVNVLTRSVEKTYSMPVYAVSPKGDFGLSLDFSLLHKCRRGYGYSNNVKTPFDNKAAVYKIDMSSGVSTPIIMMSQIRERFKDSVAYEKDYINHLSIAPDGEHFIFFYIRVSKGKRQTHLMVANNDGREIRHLLSGMSPSHYGWKNDHEILITAQGKNGRLSYSLVNLDGRFSIIQNSGLMRDGHPTFLNASNFISDTYPSRMGKQTVFAYNMTERARSDIASFYLPSQFAGERRCDLHPRLSQDKKFACVDIVRNGRRCMAIIPLPEVKK